MPEQGNQTKFPSSGVCDQELPCWRMGAVGHKVEEQYHNGHGG